MTVSYLKSLPWSRALSVYSCVYSCVYSWYKRDPLIQQYVLKTMSLISYPVTEPLSFVSHHNVGLTIDSMYLFGLNHDEPPQNTGDLSVKFFQDFEKMSRSLNLTDVLTRPDINTHSLRIGDLSLWLSYGLSNRMKGLYFGRTGRDRTTVCGKCISRCTCPWSSYGQRKVNLTHIDFLPILLKVEFSHHTEDNVHCIIKF